jgi:hypothetical protein
VIAGVLLVTICLQPLDPVDPDVVRVAARGIDHVYGFVVSVLPAKSLPRETWSPRASAIVPKSFSIS